jgi:hypothetical protein
MVQRCSEYSAVVTFTPAARDSCAMRADLPPRTAHRSRHHVPFGSHSAAFAATDVPEDRVLAEVYARRSGEQTNRSIGGSRPARRHRTPACANCRTPQRKIRWKSSCAVTNASTLLTSNRPVDDWGKLLGDTAAVTALLDRLSSRARAQMRTTKPAHQSPD